MGRLSNADSPGRSLMSAPPRRSKTPPSTPVSPFRVCDKCGYAHDGEPISRAKHQVDVPGGTLYFCNHHFAEYALAFIASNYRCVRI